MDLVVAILVRKSKLLWPDYETFDPKGPVTYEDYLIDLGFDRPASGGKPLIRTNFKNQAEFEMAADKKFDGDSCDRFLSRLDCYSTILFAILGTDLSNIFFLGGNGKFRSTTP